MNRLVHNFSIKEGYVNGLEANKDVNGSSEGGMTTSVVEGASVNFAKHFIGFLESVTCSAIKLKTNCRTSLSTNSHIQLRKGYQRFNYL